MNGFEDQEKQKINKKINLNHNKAGERFVRWNQAQNLAYITFLKCEKENFEN